MLVNGWVADPMRWAVTENLITGTTATALSPAAPATRAQLAAILMRFIKGMEGRSNG